MVVILLVHNKANTIMEPTAYLLVIVFYQKANMFPDKIIFMDPCKLHESTGQ